MPNMHKKSAGSLFWRDKPVKTEEVPQCTDSDVKNVSPCLNFNCCCPAHYDNNGDGQNNFFCTLQLHHLETLGLPHKWTVFEHYLCISFGFHVLLFANLVLFCFWNFCPANRTQTYPKQNQTGRQKIQSYYAIEHGVNMAHLQMGYIFKCGDFSQLC